MIYEIVSFFHKIAIKCLVTLIYVYQQVISPLVGKNCRFSPTCSHYAIEAIKGHGALYGLWLTFLRIIKCHPFGHSQYDPVPPNKKMPND